MIHGSCQPRFICNLPVLVSTDLAKARITQVQYKHDTNALAGTTNDREISLDTHISTPQEPKAALPVKTDTPH